MTQDSNPPDSAAAMSDGRQDSRPYLRYCLIAAAIAVVIYLSFYLLLRRYRHHTENVAAISYGDACFHVYGPRQERSDLLRSRATLASPHTCTLPFMTGAYGNAVKFWPSLLFVPAELLEVAIRSAFGQPPSSPVEP